MENYLLSIYTVQERGAQVTNANLVLQLRRVPASENLGTSLPAVSGMLRRMERENLIRLGETRDIDLTNKGRQLAESMIRKHRLAARMVVDLLGVPLHEVDAEAHMLEHALSDSLEKRIQKRLGNPKTDPFGQPIPGSGYRPTEVFLVLAPIPLPKQGAIGSGVDINGTSINCATGVGIKRTNNQIGKPVAVDIPGTRNRFTKGVAR